MVADTGTAEQALIALCESRKRNRACTPGTFCPNGLRGGDEAPLTAPTGVPNVAQFDLATGLSGVGWILRTGRLLASSRQQEASWRQIASGRTMGRARRRRPARARSWTGG